MNLIVDVGNSFVKLAVFNGGQLLFKEVVGLNDLMHGVNSIQKVYPDINNAIVASVAKLRDSHIKFLKQGFDLITLNPKTKLPFKNNYKTPKTLGVDRLALVSASVYHYPNKDVLIIDAGTCITYDFITANKEYLGGAISPGIRMRYKALHDLTANLPLLEAKEPKELVGDSTEASIHSGVIHGVLNEIDGVINNYRLNNSDLTVILTGGDTNFLSKQLKSSIFANSNFLLEGLNYILQFNLN